MPRRHVGRAGADRRQARGHVARTAIAEVLREADAAPDCIGVIAWMHTFSPAKMWIAGLLDLRKPLLHLHTQYHRDLPWAEIDMDFMNLNQAAHGDREFGFIQTRLRRRRKTVVGHWQDPIVARAARQLGARRRRLARGASPAHRPVRRQHARGRRHRGRQGRGRRSRLGVSVNGYGVSELVGARATPCRGRDVDALVERVRRSCTTSSPALRPRRRAARRAARRPPGSRPACASFLEDGGFGAFTDTFEDLGGLAQLPGLAVQRLMADGYGFGAEGDWKTAALVRDRSR